ncbi:MAG TPA: hypothetical protein VF885_07435 [Arthrobacter sp.]
MSTATVPALTDDAFAALRELLMGTSQGPVQKPVMWAASYGGPGTRIFTGARAAATFITEETRRRVKAGNPEPVTVDRLDGAMDPDWNASSDVADVLAATGWTARCADPAYAVAWCLRDEVIDVLEAILVPAH